MCVSIPIQGWHLSTETWSIRVGSLHEVASLIEKYDITLYESENFDILKYCYENYAHNVYGKEFIERMTVALEENNDMHEYIDNYDSDDLI